MLESTGPRPTYGRGPPYLTHVIDPVSSFLQPGNLPHTNFLERDQSMAVRISAKNSKLYDTSKEHIEKVCDRFAQEGYVAIAPALFHREHPNPKLGYGDEDVTKRNQYMGALRDDELVDDINQVILWTQSEQFRRTNGQKIGIVGYCVGGRITYLAATSCPGLSAASVYYGGRLLVPFGDGPAPLDLTSNIKIPVMGNFGDLPLNTSDAVHHRTRVG